VDSVIEAHALTRRFGDLVAVDHVGFAVQSGEVFGFLGPNGAGKTTTVRMLTGVLDPTLGTALIQGHDIMEDPLSARAHLGVLPEEANCYLDLSVWRNLMLSGELYGLSAQQRKREGERLLDMVGLADRKRQKARTLSKGLRQRLMMACALVSNPDVLFLDEPTGGLDVKSARLLRDRIRGMKPRGVTVFLTTHNMDEAEELCDRVAIINHGRIAAIESPAELKARMKSSQHVEVSFAGAALPRDALESLPGVLNVIEKDGLYRVYSESPGQLATEMVRLCDQKGAEVDSLCTCKASLEQVFLQLTGGEGQE